MYATAGAIPRSRLPPGSVLSIVGPPLSGKSKLLVQLLAIGAERGQDAVLVTTDGILASDLLERLDSEYHDRVTVVDASGGAPSDAPSRVRTLSSPADLTGIAIGVSEALKTAEGEGRRIRIAVHSLTTIAPHVGEERLYRLVDELSRQIRAAEGLGLYSLHSTAPGDGFLANLSGLFDGRIETRTDPPGVRIVELNGESTEWQSLTDIVSRATSTAVAAEPPRPEEPPPSLRSIVDRVEGYRLTLTLCNVNANVVTDLEEAFELCNIQVESTTAADLPVDMAVLQRDGEFIAADAARALRDEVTLKADRAPRRSTVLEAADGNVFGVRSVGRRLLVDASRRFETAAARHGGTIHAGFQAVSRLASDPETLAVYRGIVESGADVHVYGRVDTDLPLTDVTLHHGANELADSWFVVYDGGESTQAAGALLAIEEGNGTYRGFWTGDRELTGELLGYLEQNYLDPEAAADA